MKGKINYWMGLLVVLLAGTASWALYNFINMSAEDLLTKFKITNPYQQSIIVLLTILVFFILAGFGAKKSIEKIIK